MVTAVRALQADSQLSPPHTPRLFAGIEALLRFGAAAKGPLAVSVLLALTPTLLEVAPFFLIYLAVDALVSGSASFDGLALLAMLAVLATLVRSVLWGAAMWSTTCGCAWLISWRACHWATSMRDGVGRSNATWPTMRTGSTASWRTASRS